MSSVTISVGFPPTQRAPEQIAWAEQLGYDHAYLFDTPFEGDDVWVQLHNAAAKTNRIGLGPGVLVPSLRHPLVNAANTVSLHQLAPGRVSVGFGTGFSSRAATGQPALPWAYMSHYIRTYQALLRGEIAEWEGAPIKLLLTSDLARQLPLRVPILVGTLGPKGHKIAHEVHADGIINMFEPTSGITEFDRGVLVLFGTILDPGETPSDDRVRAAIGPIWGGMFHFAYTTQGADEVRKMPGGPEWLEVIERHPAAERHLSIHQGHFLEMNEADQAAWNAGGHVSVTETTLSGPAQKTTDYVRAQIARGVTEIMLQPTGPDLRREMATFADAARAAN